MKQRRKKSYDSAELSPASDDTRAELFDANLKRARKIGSLGVGMITYFTNEKNNCSQLLDLLETCHRHSERHGEMLAKVRGHLGRIDGLLASFGLEPNVTRH